uniref:Uncharacterized protein n=1 Tax=Rhizophora mucronata TaxID=61149 RepID=A0A2P2PNN1_RHIMU
MHSLQSYQFTAISNFLHCKIKRTTIEGASDTKDCRIATTNN